MKFCNEAARQAHSMARLIPRSLWDGYRYFSKELPNELLPLMEAESYETLKEQVIACTAKILRQQDKHCIWLGLTFAHPQLSTEGLNELADQLNLSVQERITLACATSRIDYLKLLEQTNTLVFHTLLQDPKPEFFKDAAACGHLEVLRLIESKVAPERFQKMIVSCDYYAFIWAAQYGHLEILHFFESKVTPDILQKLIAANGFAALHSATMFGQLGVVRYLESKLTPKLFQEMIVKDDYDVFRLAASTGNLVMFRYFESKIKQDKRLFHKMIAANDFAVFGEAAQNGHLVILLYLESKITPGLLPKMIAAKDFNVFRYVAQNGHLEVLRYLESKVTADIVQKMIKAKNFDAFKSAAEQGHLEVLRYLESKAPELLQNMIEEEAFYAYQYAAKNGHLEVLRYLESKVRPERLQAMVATNQFSALSGATQYKHHHVINHLLQFSAVFAYAEQHVSEYRDAYIAPLITETLENLHAQRHAFESALPNAVFNLEDDDQSHFLFYVLRHLIRINNPEHRDEIQFLLDIPSVKSLAHTEVTPNMSNELLRLALSVGNQEAAALLLNIPEVRTLAEQNDFYRAEQQGQLDLRRLAQDSESAMIALSQGEQQRLQAATARYQPKIHEAGVASIIGDLRTTLKNRYDEHPATLGELTLPFRWTDFQALNLAEPDYTQALKAYYQHPNHSAWRYLAKPNPWMHKQAAYVYINEEQTERWSTFEEYQPLIAMLFCAAQDKEIPAEDGYTLESRLELFIKELALIGRAHNWDETRHKTDAEGIVVLDDEDMPTEEEFDNLEGDRPSCFSGVKRRLFQSVHGHPLLAFLTKEKITLELNHFIRAHFQKVIAEHTPLTIKTIWGKILNADPLSEEDHALLKLLDVPQEQQTEFRASLAKKYSQQFTQDPTFMRFIDSAFALQSKSDAHILHFGHLNLEVFMDQHQPIGTPRELSFFGAANRKNAAEDDLEQRNTKCLRQ
jgi:hypothetical protein